MRYVRRSAVVALVLALGTVPAMAQDPWEPTAGGWVSGDLDWVDTVPFDAGTAIGAVLHDDTLIVTSWRGFSIYDVADPEDPKPLHRETDLYMINEEPQTNGEILLLSNDSYGRALEIWNISDPAAPAHIGTYDNPRPAASRDHIWTCVDDCAFAYGSHGTILDLSDPTAPKEVGDWKSATGNLRNYHHITEVAPGFVLVGGLPVVYLDAGEDPARPTELARFEPHSRSFNSPYVVIRGHNPSIPAQVDWPGEAEDRFVLVSMESPFSGDCSEGSGTFGTFDSDGWDAEPPQDEEAFGLVDEYGPDSNGPYHDGSAPVNFWGCSTYSFDVHPEYEDTRAVALTMMEHGLRLLSVSEEDGAISELGGFVPVAGSSGGAIWITDEVLYSIDLHRGIDILRYTRDPDDGRSDRRREGGAGGRDRSAERAPGRFLH